VVDDANRITIYTPKIWLCNYFEPARWAMKRYVGLWTDQLPILLDR